MPSTTMDDIASEAGVEVRAVYYTFRTKGALFCELMDVTSAGGEVAPPVTAANQRGFRSRFDRRCVLGSSHRP
jgi:AcrR family transcriptional regulator